MDIAQHPIADADRPGVPAAIRTTRLVAIGRNLDPSSLSAVAEALVEGGVRAFELTLNTDAALDGIAALSKSWKPDQLLVGAGTVLDEDHARRAVEAGATFLVTPHLDPSLVRWAADRGIPCMPGAFSPTEVLTAWRAGAAAVKVFPASVLGPAYVREMRGPLPAIPLVPTGGVTIDNARAFIAAGALAVGMGSWLTGGGNAAVIRDRATAIVAALAAGD